ncbi:hypothetical protein ABRP77_14800 [Pectobacterium odoriferum]|uniref:hypothetical protein n=1 Tax=Pectobacterium odoriferum TaxID=78398 RepID=UPI0032EFF9F3
MSTILPEGAVPSVTIPRAGMSLAQFTDARRLIESPSHVQTFDADELDDEQQNKEAEADEQALK